ncbi:helix-hairpin-helix domain-containing protein [bacterium]|nr:helix-hairpin-helix domain-containing protein [bacterium]
MMKSKKTLLYTLCFISLVAIIFSAFISIPGVTFAREGKEGKAAKAGKAAKEGKKFVSEEKININTATEEELVKLKRIGPRLAKDIIEFREKNGPFKNIEDILKVKGIGPKFWEANKDRITVSEEETKPAEEASESPEEETEDQ